MRRSLVLAAFALAAAAPMTPAAAAPDCDVAQNCVCDVVNFVLDKVGEELGCA